MNLYSVCPHIITIVTNELFLLLIDFNVIVMVNNCNNGVNVVLIEDHMIKDFSHELSNTQQHVEQMVQQMMNSLANIRLAKYMMEMVQSIIAGGILYLVFHWLQLGDVSWEYLSEIGSRVVKVTSLLLDTKGSHDHITISVYQSIAIYTIVHGKMADVQQQESDEVEHEIIV